MQAGYRLFFLLGGGVLCPGLLAFEPPGCWKGHLVAERALML